MRLREKVENLRRVLAVARKPKISEYLKVLKICMMGILFVGLIGFVFYLIFVILGV